MNSIPDNTIQQEIRTWLIRANDLHLKGQWEQAEQLYRKILSRYPHHPEALHLLGLLMHQRGNHKAAIDLIGQAISINGRSPAYFVNRGVALLSNGMPDAAIEHFRAALKLSPGLAQAYLNLGNALRSQKKFSEAEFSYQQAIHSVPRLAEAHFNLGFLLQEQGKLDAAAACFRQTTRIQPGRCDAYYHLSRCMRMSGEGRQIASEILGVLNQGGISEKDAVHCHFALGKIYDDLGEYANAFRHYDQANQLEQKQAVFNREEHSRLIDWIIETFSADFLAMHREAGSTSDRPIFIVGMPRSGTTLVEQIVSSHSGVFGAGELEFWLEQGEQYGPSGIAAPSNQQIASFSEKYLAYLHTLSDSARFVTDKMPHNFLYLGLIHLAFPRARIIHCLRNPADTCLSIYCHKFTRLHGYATNLENLAFYYREYSRLIEHWRRVLPDNLFQGIRYEELVADQANTSRRMIEALGLEWEERCLDFHRNARLVSTPSNWQVQQPIYRDSLARWKNYLPFIAPLLPLAEEYKRDADEAPAR